MDAEQALDDGLFKDRFGHNYAVRLCWTSVRFWQRQCRLQLSAVRQSCCPFDGFII